MPTTSSRIPSRSAAAASRIRSTFASRRRPTSPASTRASAGIRQTGRFFLIDLSSLGTTLNGRHVPKGYDEVDGAKRENGAETALPDTAKIGLADTVFLELRRYAMMTALLWARPVFAVILLALVGLLRLDRPTERS